MALFFTVALYGLHEKCNAAFLGIFLGTSRWRRGWAYYGGVDKGVGLSMVGLVGIGMVCWKRSHLKGGAEKTTWCSVDCAFRVGFRDVRYVK